MKSRFVLAVFAMVVVLGACSGGESADTTGEGQTATTEGAASPPPTEDNGGDGPTIGLGDIPQECVDAFVDFLQEIEPALEGVDWDNANLEDLEAVSEDVEAASNEFESVFTGECDDLNVDASTDESFEFMIEIARDEAPGTVPYFEFIRDFAAGFDGVGGDGGEVDGGETGGEGIQVTNDCETDIATMQAIVDQGGTIEDVPIADLPEIGNLSVAIGLNCTPERSSDFFAQEDVSAFLGG